MLNWYTNSSIHKWFVDNVWKPSWTRLTASIYGIPAALVGIGQAISKIANDPTISGYLAQMHVPDWIPSLLSGIALIHYLAHGRD